MRRAPRGSEFPPAREARNPKTGESVDIPSRRKVMFRASSLMHKALNEE